MTPIQVKNLICEAVGRYDAWWGWPAMVQIAGENMYINIAKPATTEPGMLTIARWANRPCKCGCGLIIPPGTKVWWEPSWGISIPEHVGK